ncbi:MAG: hypothetical protein NTU61_02055 [Candidatus Altiarchaeota archaeon]|nr:hypothetical protein [Candidatus Altiarchaeota archaeon]
MAEQKKMQPVGELASQLDRQVSERLNGLGVKAVLGTPEEQDHLILGLALIDAFGLVRDSMNLSKPENEAMRRIEAQRIRIAELRADVNQQTQGPKVQVAGNKMFIEFFRVMVTDFEEFDKSGLDHLPDSLGVRHPLPPDYKAAIPPLKEMLGMIEDGRMQTLDKGYVTDDLLRNGIVLNEWQNVNALGPGKAKEYSSRVDLAIGIMRRTINRKISRIDD